MLCAANPIIATEFYLNGSVTFVGVSEHEVLSPVFISLVSSYLTALIANALGNDPITTWSFGVGFITNATGSCVVTVRLCLCEVCVCASCSPPVLVSPHNTGSSW